MSNYWEDTINALQGSGNAIFDKPKLVEKYLVKPPFRYLHDIISAVQKSSGFAPGLYDANELNHETIQDKDAKIAYLTKIIDCVGIFLNESIPTKAVKIVAGLEPESTNLFLQKLGQACRKGNAADAVQRVLNGEHAGEGSKAAAPAAKPAPKPAPAEKPAAAPAPKPSKSEAPKAEAPRPDDKVPSPDPKASKSSSKPKAPKAEAPAAEAPAAPPAKPAAPPKEPRVSSKAAAPPPPKEEPKAEAPPPRSKAPKAPPPAEEARPEPESRPPPGPPASGGEDPSAQKYARPQSARKAPPKVVSNTDPNSVRAGARPPSRGIGRPAVNVPNILSRPVQVFDDGDKMNDDDDVEVVHEAAPPALSIPTAPANQGVLVKNIIEAERQLKHTTSSLSGSGGEGGDGGGGGIILKRSKATFVDGPGRAGRPHDPNSLKEAVQRLVHAATPLAKIMDYLGEDVENMAKECRFWMTEKRLYQDRLNEEQRLAGDNAQSEAHIADLDGQIKQVKDRILGSKAQILKNDEKISNLLAMAVAG